MFSMKLTTRKPLGEISIEPYEIREYDNELDDGRSIIADICRIFEDTKEIFFEVSGFGEERWRLDCFMDLCVVIEQLPEIMSSINSNNYNFDLDFYEQGAERYIRFTDMDNDVKLVCTCLNNWKPMPDTIQMEKEKISKDIKILYETFIAYGEILCPDLMSHPMFKEWMKIN